MDTSAGQYHGGRGWIADQVGEVVAPIAERCLGWPTEQIRPMLATAWRREFDSTLGEPALTDTAAAIHEGRSWSQVLWTGGW
jgi:hypothetical protein